MYGLSLTASLICASATRRLASATRRTRSSGRAAGVADPEAGVGPLETVGDGLALNTTFEAATAGTMGTLGTGAARATGGRAEVAPMLARAGLVFIIPASLAAISARFCATSSAGDSWRCSENTELVSGEIHTPVVEVEGALEFEVF